MDHKAGLHEVIHFERYGALKAAKVRNDGMVVGDVGRGEETYAVAQDCYFRESTVVTHLKEFLWVWTDCILVAQGMEMQIKTFRLGLVCLVSGSYILALQFRVR